MWDRSGHVRLGILEEGELWGDGPGDIHTGTIGSALCLSRMIVRRGKSPICFCFLLPNLGDGSHEMRWGTSAPAQTREPGREMGGQMT